MADKPYDLAILGAGQAGCTLAGKIAEHGVNPITVNVFMKRGT